VGKLGIVDWREDCSSCHNCVKRGCVYGLYRDEANTLREEVGYLDYIYQCKGCLNCIQNCTKNLLTRVVNPEYRRLGDRHYTPEIITTTWFQAETGRVPVSGSGYGGRFSGPGFDSMWTDMSEIVRPTRDGIHGREYINTSVDIGRKLPHLAFQADQMVSQPPALVEIPLPIIFDVVPQRWHVGSVVKAVVETAAKLGTLAVMEPKDITPGQSQDLAHVVPLLDSGDGAAYPWAPMVMIADGPDGASRKAIKDANPDQVVAIRVQASPACAARVVELARDGAEVIHLVFTEHGLEFDAQQPRHMRDVLREVHGALVKAGLRDEVTLIASGGIALPEHTAKAIICGADLVAIDVPLGIALDCRLCRECERGEPCQVAMEEVPAGYAVHRMLNLIGSWHSQLLEVLGAMGIREVRRLRGECGRAMFFEDLERDSFGRLFGRRRTQQEVAR
jgi:ferredoxin